jgi:2-haloacid dehalogenase
MQIDPDRYDALTFDCYGTLIDWETGLTAFLRPLIERHDVHAVDGFLLEFFGRAEAELQAGPYRSYRDVLRGVLRLLGERLAFHPDAETLAAFADSVGEWLPFPDAVRALKSLAGRFQLVVVSNIDDDLFDLTQARLGINFDAVITAAQVKAYKPDPRVFEAALQRTGVPRERTLHVAQSMYHDIAPASALGFDTVWIDRHAGRGGGATRPAEATPTWRMRDLAELAAALAAVS